jgi:hypothetical protein
MMHWGRYCVDYDSIEKSGGPNGGFYRVAAAHICVRQKHLTMKSVSVPDTVRRTHDAADTIKRLAEALFSGP